jgi:GxxExxY protein
MLVENQIIIENKCVERLLPIHMAQILTYLKLRQIKLGFLINWNTPLVKNGIKRVANEL